MIKYDEFKGILEKYAESHQKTKETVNCVVEEKNLLTLLRELNSAGVKNLLSMSPMDMGDTIDVLYHFSFGKNESETLTIRTSVPKSHPEVDSIIKIYPGATILEQESYEMLGIVFKGHDGLKGAFLAKDSPKTPLRKE